jgi:16S rRNA C967 or C1407 C5-methylase (RsmB/RsmF family)
MVDRIDEPKDAISRLSRKLFLDDASTQAAFVRAVNERAGARSVVLQLHGAVPASAVSHEVMGGWIPSWARFAEQGEEPGKAEEHVRGDWYVLDQSSVFCASPVLGITSKVETALDLCASPGGKACFLWRHAQPKLLVVNEPIKGRLLALISNIKRCRIDPCVVVAKDPSILEKLLPALFDLVVVDAPCSGQSLHVKGKISPGAFHSATVNMNVKRQRRILAAAAAMVRPGGNILYSTCTFSREENEGNLEWFVKRFPDWRTAPVAHLDEYQSKLSSEACYRLWPFQGEGAGGFTCLLVKGATNTEHELPRSPHVEWSSTSGKDALAEYIKEEHGESKTSQKWSGKS